MARSFPLVRIFAEIFDCFRRTAELDIDVSFVPQGQIRIVWHDPGVVHSSPIDLNSSSSICGTPSSIRCVRILIVHNGIFLERLGETFSALALFHAGSSWIEITTGTMDHVGGDNLRAVCHHTATATVALLSQARMNRDI